MSVFGGGLDILFSPGEAETGTESASAVWGESDAGCRFHPIVVLDSYNLAATAG
jgi:hypothetical protein